MIKDERRKNSAFQGLIQAYEGMEEWDGVEQVTHELARQPSPEIRAFVRLYKGKVLMYKKQYKQAIKELERAELTTKNDDNANIILLLGKALSLTGEYQKSNNILTAFKKQYHEYKKNLKRAEEIINGNNQSLKRKKDID